MPKSKLELFPEGTVVDTAGHLLLDGHRVADLIDQYGSPLYLYHLPTIRRQIEAYRQGLATYAAPSRLTYASKAFLCSALAKFLTAEDVGLDMSSAGELFIARRGGANPANIHFHGNNKTRRDLVFALDNQIGRIVVDNVDELAMLAQLTAQRKQRVSIWIRVNPDIAVTTHHHYTLTGTADSKFGLPLTHLGPIATDVLRGKFSPYLHLTGLHMHLGSHFHDVSPVAAAVMRLLDAVQSLNRRHGWQLRELCPGGGWGVPYHPADPEMEIEPFVSELVGAITTACQQRQLKLPRLILEPGRSLVAKAGVALYKVGAYKELPGGRKYVSVDGGLADNPRPALYQARYTALVANKAATPETETVTLAGPYCESGDILIEQVNLPPISADDVVAVPVAGAYQLSMGSNYNGSLKPALIFIDGKEIKLVQRRETFEDLIRRDLI
jgi:diaminopimelate decarboxylase